MAGFERGEGSRPPRKNPHRGFRHVPMEEAPKKEQRPRRRIRMTPEAAQSYADAYAAAPRDANLPTGWHLNPNRVPVPPPPTGEARRRRILEIRASGIPGFVDDPGYAVNGPKWDEYFRREHEMRRNSFFASSPPAWFDDEDPRSDDEETDSEDDEPWLEDDPDAARCDDDMYIRLPEERPPPGFGWPAAPPRDPSWPPAKIESWVFLDD